jgi:hypothetical protein
VKKKKKQRLLEKVMKAAPPVSISPLNPNLKKVVKNRK